MKRDSSKSSKITIWFINILCRLFGETLGLIIFTGCYMVLSMLGNLCLLYLGLRVLYFIGWLPITP